MRNQKKLKQKYLLVVVALAASTLSYADVVNFIFHNALPSPLTVDTYKGNMKLSQPFTSIAPAPSNVLIKAVEGTYCTFTFLAPSGSTVAVVSYRNGSLQPIAGCPGCKWIANGRQPNGETSYDIFIRN